MPSPKKKKDPRDFETREALFAKYFKEMASIAEKIRNECTREEDKDAFGIHVIAVCDQFAAKGCTTTSSIHARALHSHLISSAREMEEKIARQEVGESPEPSQQFVQERINDIIRRMQS